MARVRVLVAERERAFAQALAFRLSREATLDVLGSVCSGAATEAEVLRSHPDVVVLGEGLDGDVRAIAQRLSKHPHLRIVAMVSLEAVWRASTLVRAGACGIVIKDGEIGDLVDAIHGAARNESHIPPRVLGRVLDELCNGSQPPEQDERLARLTPRERDVLACMMAGLDRARIAQRMVLSTNTIRTHAQNLFAKLGVHSTLEAVSVALGAGFADPPRPPESFYTEAEARPHPTGESGPRAREITARSTTREATV
jgi:DNA-binding NarL/FixJ family response regulator